MSLWIRLHTKIITKNCDVNTAAVTATVTISITETSVTASPPAKALVNFFRFCSLTKVNKHEWLRLGRPPQRRKRENEQVNAMVNDLLCVWFFFGAKSENGNRVHNYALMCFYTNFTNYSRMIYTAMSSWLRIFTSTQDNISLPPHRIAPNAAWHSLWIMSAKMYQKLAVFTTKRRKKEANPKDALPCMLSKRWYTHFMGYCS